MLAVKPPQVRTSDMKLEVIVIPVANVDRAKGFMAAWAGGSTPISASRMVSA